MYVRWLRDLCPRCGILSNLLPLRVSRTCDLLLWQQWWDVTSMIMLHFIRLLAHFRERFFCWRWRSEEPCYELNCGEGYVAGHCGWPLWVVGSFLLASGKKPDPHSYSDKEEKFSFIEYPGENTAQSKCTLWLQPWETLSGGHKEAVPSLLNHRNFYMFQFVVIC